uniref:Putative secreted protein n=1 Tax=Anopheles marajoara TaxID=58244 RepID=A0A2M4CE56_9DIPT
MGMWLSTIWMRRRPLLSSSSSLLSCACDDLQGAWLEPNRFWSVVWCGRFGCQPTDRPIATTNTAEEGTVS